MHRRARRLVILAALAGLYFAAGKLGLSLAFLNENASAVWPPAGISLAALLVLGPRVWPAIALGAFLVNVTTSGYAGSSAVIAAGNTIEGLAGAWLVTRFARGRAAFERAGDILRFTVLAGMVSTAIAATVGAVTLVGAGLAARSDAGSVWLTWWLGDAVGTVMVAPLLILWAAPRGTAWTTRRAVEALALAASLVAVGVLVFGATPAGLRRYPLEFLTIPFLLWAAFRFGGREAAAAVTLLSVVAIQGTLNGYGPFARSSPNESLLLLQAFMGVLSTVMLVVAAEISARRTEELVKVHDRLTEAQQVAHIGNWEWDIKTDTLWWSEELYRLYGVPPGARASYDTFLERVHPGDRERIDAVVRAAITAGDRFAFDHRIVQPDGNVRVLHGEGRVIRNADGQPVRMVGTGHDVTDRKRAEEERELLIREQVARREAEDANRAKDQFLATLSHELRTPLNAALGWAQMLLRPDMDEARRARAPAAIYRNLLVQARLVSDIIDVSRIARGTMRLETKSVDVAALIDAAVETVREAADARRVRVATRQDSGHLEIIGDAPRLQQVVWNLLSNAVKFARKDGVVSVVTVRHAAYVEIVVEDDGPGIAPDFLPHVFEQFRQADPSVTREHGGLGLGLAIARHIVELHGGTIAAANRAAGGARFTVRLPLAPASDQAVASPAR